MSDPFNDFAEENLSAANKARLARAETRAERRIAKQLVERDMLFEQWTQWHEKRKRELFDGPWRKSAVELSAFLEKLTIDNADDLIELVTRQNWRGTDRDTRYLVQSMISHAIIYLREREGLPPFDDPLIGEELNASLIIRELLRCDTPSSTSATSGVKRGS